MPDQQVAQSETLGTMKIKLLVDLPLHTKHEANKGNVYDAEYIKDAGRGAVRFWITGATGERIGVLSHEAEALAGAASGKDKLARCAEHD